MNYFNSTFLIKPGAKRMKRTQIKRVPGTARLVERKPLNKVGRRGKRDSPKLARWRREVRERDDYTCQYPGCGKRSKRIDVHHIAKRTERPDLKFEVSNGVCLCRLHHQRSDTHLQEAIELRLRSIESYELAKKEERQRVA